MARSAITTVDEAGRVPLRLGAFDHWTPTRRNDEQQGLELSLGWLARQRCPYHPDATVTGTDGKVRGFTHVRAHWARIRLGSGALTWRPAAMLRCVRDHAWTVIIADAI